MKDTPGFSWILLGSPGYSWVLLHSPAFPWILILYLIPALLRYLPFLLQEVEVMTAKWDFYISMVGFSIGLLVMPLLGSWSDAVGRKPIMIISNMGMALQTVVYLLVMYLKLPVAYFIVGRIVCGLGGEISMLVATCFSYMADISDSSCRTFRVAVLESCLGISMILSGIIGGEWKAAHG